MSATDTLKRLQILSDWTDAELESMARRMEEVQVRSGTALLKEGESATAAFILKSGRLRILSRGEVIGAVDTVACFGEISCLLVDTPVTATVVAESDAIVFRVARDDMLATAQEVPKLWRALFAQMTGRLQGANKRLSEILDHSPQGFLKLDRSARITNEYSSKCLEYLGRAPLCGVSLPELLNPGDAQGAASWKSVFDMVFDEVGVPLSDLFDLLTPEARIEADGVLRDLRLAFHPTYDANGTVSAVDVGIEDITRQRELERAQELERGRQTILGKIYQNPDSFFSLLRLIEDVESSGATLIASLRTQGSKAGPQDIARFARELHSLKGCAGSFGSPALRRVQQAAGRLETELAALATTGAAASAAVALQEAFDRLLEANAEGKALRDMIDPCLLQRLEGVVLVPTQLQAMQKALAAGDAARASAILQAAESVDVKQLFACWSADIERLCTLLGKQARLEVFGAGGLVPKPIFMALDQVLVHVLNNAMDHGMEDAETRLCAEKPTQGVIRVMVEVSAGRLMIEIADDGRGIAPEPVIAKARAHPGLDQALVQRFVDLGEPWRVLLLPGFSTAAQVSETSGRGVGLDAVNSTVVSLGGTLDMLSRPGQGTTLRIQLPLADAEIHH